MAERVWEWQLGTGESVVARIDPSADTESVFLGARLVSRSRRGAAPRGHEVRQRGIEEGAYRGAKQVRVLFQGEDCSLVVDGEVMTASTSPPTGPPAVRFGRVAAVSAIAAMLMLTLMLMLIGMASHRPSYPSQPARSSNAQGPITQIPPRLPNTETHRSSNGLLTIHYPADFRMTVDARVGETASVVHFDRDGGHETMELFSVRLPDTTDVWKLDASIQKASEKSWSAHGTVTTDVERSDGKCHGEDAAIALRHLSVRGFPVRQWSCTFVHEGHAFRFTTFVQDWLTADEDYLRSIVDAAVL